MNWKKILPGLFFCFVCSQSIFGAVVHDTVYINKGELITIDTNYYAFYAFNESPDFVATNNRINLAVGDSIYLAVVNTDTENHGFDVKNTTDYDVEILPGDTVEVPMLFSEPGAYIFYDHLDYPKYRYLGLGATITVDNFDGDQFFWNIKDHLGDWNDSLDGGYTVDWSMYYPDYFTINGFSNPLINDDPYARVAGAVGETMRIYITNTGQGTHSLHFHGYHLEIIYSSKNSSHEGRVKDTFPIESMETLILELVPDKTGEYPVHDHNLVAVSGGNIYPNGMFLTMLIE